MLIKSALLSRSSPTECHYLNLVSRLKKERKNLVSRERTVNSLHCNACKSGNKLQHTDIWSLFQLQTNDNYFTDA